MDQALVALWPKFQAWVIGFVVLAFFWMGHRRSFSYVRRADGNLVALDIGQLACVTPDAVLVRIAGRVWRRAVSGGVLGLRWCTRATGRCRRSSDCLRCATSIVVRSSRPRRCRAARAYSGARIRIVGPIVVGCVAVLIRMAVGDTGGRGIGHAAFPLMAVIVPLSRRTGRAGNAVARDGAFASAPTPDRGVDRPADARDDGVHHATRLTQHGHTRTASLRTLAPPCGR